VTGERAVAAASTKPIPPAPSALSTLLRFWRTVLAFVVRVDYTGTPGAISREPARVKTHLYGLAVVFRYWRSPHYWVAGTLGDEFRRQLRDVAIPGTGVRLSWVCISRFTVLIFLFVVYPIVALITALHSSWSGASPSTAHKFREVLLEPKGRLSLFTLNCILPTLHQKRTKASGYLQEDRFAFVENAERLGLPVAPCVKAGSFVVKGRGEEARGGAKFFRNAAHGGNWIIQERLENDAFVASLVPPDAPLSTFQVVTASRGGGLEHADVEGRGVVAIGCAFRAGRAGAQRDDPRSAILFDVDLRTGLMSKGKTSDHWHRLGIWGVLGAWRQPKLPAEGLVHHPDCGVRIAGRTVPDIKAIEELCIDAHRKMVPDIPIASWDVALTTRGRLLLQMNLSCDLAGCAVLDHDSYFELLDEYFALLDRPDVAERFHERRLEPM